MLNSLFHCGISFDFRRHKPRYEFLSLKPRVSNTGAASTGAVLANGVSNGGGPVVLNNGTVVGGGGNVGSGWCGEDESDIPVSLFPKHVLGLHAEGDMALLQVRTFFSFCSSCPKL